MASVRAASELAPKATTSWVLTSDPSRSLGCASDNPAKGEPPVVIRATKTQSSHRCREDENSDTYRDEADIKEGMGDLGAEQHAEVSGAGTTGESHPMDWEEEDCAHHGKRSDEEYEDDTLHEGEPAAGLPSSLSKKATVVTRQRNILESHECHHSPGAPRCARIRGESDRCLEISC